MARNEGKAFKNVTKWHEMRVKLKQCRNKMARNEGKVLKSTENTATPMKNKKKNVIKWHEMRVKFSKT